MSIVFRSQMTFWPIYERYLDGVRQALSNGQSLGLLYAKGVANRSPTRRSNRRFGISAARQVCQCIHIYSGTHWRKVFSI